MINGDFNGYLDFIVCLLHPDPTKLSGPPNHQPLVIGQAGVYDGKEIGFIFNKKYWGKGYAKETLEAIIKHYWACMEKKKVGGTTRTTRSSKNMNTIRADVDPRNEASLKLLKKFGFVEVGCKKNTFQTHLGWCDSVYLELHMEASRGVDRNPA